MTARTAHTRSAIDSQLTESHSTHRLWASPRQPSRLTVGLDPINDAVAPVRNQQAAASVDEQRQRVLEAGREGDDSVRATVPPELDADDASAEPTAVVLAPLGDEEAAPVRGRKALPGIEGEPIGRSMGLEVGRRRGYAVAAAPQAKSAGVSPATRPPVCGAVLDHDERVRRLRITRGVEVVLAVDCRVKATRAWLSSKPERV